MRLGAMAGLVICLVGLGWHGFARAQDNQSDCKVTPDKVAAPAEIMLGETVRVTLTLTSTCPPRVAPIDVVLVIDQSGSMGDAGKLDNAKKAAKAFLEAMDLSISRVGLVTFNQEAGLRVPLSQDARRIRGEIDSLIAGGKTNISAAIDIAHAELKRDPQGHQLALVVLTDGRNTVPADPVPVAAGRAKDDGITVAAFCAGGDCDPGLKDAASDLSLYFSVTDLAKLVELYTALAGKLQQNSIVTLTIRDEIPANMRYVAGSATPKADTDGPNVLVWNLKGDLPPAGLSYLLEPLEVGTHPTNIVAAGNFVDRRGMPGNTVFPVPVVKVRKPDCAPIPLEVYFLIDDSNCLNGATLDGEPSLVAIHQGVDKVLAQMNLGRDTAAVIGFGDAAITYQPLTADREAVLAAVDRVGMTDSTARLDKAYEEVRAQMKQLHRPGAQVVTIAVTDGPMMPSPDLAALVAGALSRMGVKHYAIGIGTLAQHSTLRAISEPGGYRDLSFGGSVIQAYTELGGMVAALATNCARPVTPTVAATPRPTRTPAPTVRPSRILLPRLSANDQ
jgi:Mg-chelatase subunit ChlD